jgi:hypothetical protein
MVYLHDKWLANDASNGCDVTHKVEIEFLVERCIDRARRTGQEERIAVRGCLHDRLGADIGVGAGAGFDDASL